MTLEQLSQKVKDYLEQNPEKKDTEIMEKGNITHYLNKESALVEKIRIEDIINS